MHAFSGKMRKIAKRERKAAGRGDGREGECRRKEFYNLLGGDCRCLS
jgi:hypothetical protein